MTNKELEKRIENLEKWATTTFDSFHRIDQNSVAQEKPRHDFKVGDRVQFKSWDEMEKEYPVDSDGDIEIWKEYPCNTILFIKDMKYLCGTYATIDKIEGSRVKLKDFSVEVKTCWKFVTNMLKPATDEPKCRFKVGDKVNATLGNSHYIGAVIEDIGDCPALYYVRFAGDNGSCWLPEESLEPYTEPRWTFTDDEKVILRSLPEEYKWIARDDLGLYAYEDRPRREGTSFYSMDGKWYSLCLFKHLFQTLDGEDTEPCEFRKFI